MARSSRPAVVVVTGASAGVGRATVRLFARQRACIGLIARGRDALEGASQEVGQAGGTALMLPTDVGDPDQVEAAAAAVEETFGPIDVWINNAMVSVFSPVKEMTADEFRRVTEVTYLGTVYGTLSALRRMLPRNRGTIVQVGSALAYRSIPLQAAYCAAKHAVQGFTEALRCELLHERRRIRLCMVNLPALNTPQFGWVKSRLPRRPRPVPPIYQPKVAAQAIEWVVRRGRRELNVGLPTVLALLADKVAPGSADRYLAWTGYDAQQTDEPATPDRRDNLWEPVPGDPGARGTFDRQASGHSIQLWATTHRGWLTLGGIGLAAGLLRRTSGR